MNNMDSYQAKKITQCFSGVAVLHDVDFNVKAGNIHGLFGHNGAGKSTLLKILAGVNQPTKGQLLLSNQPIHIHSPKEALDHGITCVYQELRLLPQLTVWQNLFLGRELKKGIFIDTISMLDHCEKLLAEYQLTISPHALVKDLSHPDKQMLEVITNLDRKAKFLFLDEPTTALEGNQADKLLSTVQKIAKKENIGVVLVSHKLDEVLGVCDEATVMCGGKIIFHAEGKAIQKQVIIDAIIGGDKRSDNVAASLNQKQHANTNQKPMLTIANLVTPRLASINLKAYAGEILGIYGLAGSGRTRFAKTLYGLETIKKGEITLLGQNYHPKNPADAIQHGVAYLTEERKKDGFIPLMSSINNSVLSILDMFKKKGFIDHNYMQNQANEVLTKLDTKGNIHGPMTSLSGGNQQKVLFSRVINQNANLIILDEPTKGVDIGAKSDIYDIIHQLAQQQCCIIVISSEEDELIQICHRIMIFKQGMCDGKAMLTHGLTPSQLREAAWHHH